MSKQDECVKVVVRIRPMSGEEVKNGNLVAAEASPDKGLIVVKNPKSDEREPPKNFTFDSVFGPDVEQKYIYDVCAADVVESVLKGYNGTIFAYGQTGAGKTHTMEGRPDPPNLRGIIPNSFKHIFDYVSGAAETQFLVRASYLEIYNESIRDLLSKDPKNSLELRENPESGVYVKDLTSFVVKNASEIDQILQAGKKNRTTGATLMNVSSSRSHSIFTVVVESAESDSRGAHIRVGKLNLVDLAGSERQGKTGATGDRLVEATNINLSLSALGNVIKALVDGKSSHVPYRDSKLTRLLQNSLGGNAKTVMCANCGPADYNYDETLSTLRYANSAKNIKNKPKINEDPKDAMLREFQEEIARLKAQLDSTKRGVMLDEDGKEVAAVQSTKTEIIEKIVERVVVEEKFVGISDEELEEVRRKSEQEKEMLKKQAQADMEVLIKQQKLTAQERAELQTALEKEAADRQMIEKQKKTLMEKLKLVESKLIQGEAVIDKAKQQELRLRQAEQELRQKQVEETRLANELAAKEEAALQLEEHFESLQEEVEVKTKKLKKLYAKYQAAVAEAKDLQSEFQTERTDMLDTIRQLSRSLKLKDLIIQNFIPEEFAKNIEDRANWNAEEDTWLISKIELSGNRVRLNRPVSSTKSRRPETEFTKMKRAQGTDQNPRYKIENIVNLDLDMPERTTQDFDGPKMISKVDPILAMSLNDDTDEIFFESGASNNPFMQYVAGETGDDDRTKIKSNGSKKTSKSSSGSDARENRNNSGSNGARPKSASRRRDDLDNGVAESTTRFIRSDPSVDNRDAYPVARGFVIKK